MKKTKLKHTPSPDWLGIIGDEPQDDEWTLLDETRTPSGGHMALMRNSEEYAIYVNGLELMASSRHGSEELMAKIAFEALGQGGLPSAVTSGSGARFLVGGLGMGFTLRSTLNVLPSNGSVVVAELVAKVVEWNKGVLGDLAGRPLNDSRAKVVVNDVANVIKSSAGWDAVLLDVDNGPSAATQEANDWLYDLDGLEIIYENLRPGGVLAVWSVGEDRKFEQRMRKTGFMCKTLRVPAVIGQENGDMHTIFLGWQ